MLIGPNCCDKSKRFKKASKFKNEFNNSSERLALKEKVMNFKRKISRFKNTKEVSKMEESFQRWMDLNDEFHK